MNLNGILSEAKRIVKGQDEILKAILSAIIADGHILLEGPTGVGKTTIALTFSKILGLSFKRIQFTSDILPSDILGAYIYNVKTAEFQFHPGPIFANLILVDEINRASPKTQSALVEVMEERQVTIEGKTFTMEKPFIVIATQNPLDYVGTFPLPITQTDRFLMKINIDYPSKETEEEILKEGDPRAHINTLEQQCSQGDLVALQREVNSVTTDESIIDYITEIVITTRKHQMIKEGLSTRASIHILQCARAKALVEGRNYVIPEDIKDMFVYVASHRIICDVPECDTRIFLKDFIDKIPVPR
ncbi:MAG: MoxR family ATPase [Candidatus Hydrothermia bacterium]|nr:MoxR family ATPase [Candidatus Hydrothermae bacterium]HOL23324.1 MoxR family ATPase [Candidatus Hydrothermia bacterium]